MFIIVLGQHVSILIESSKRLGFHSAFLNILSKDLFFYKGLKMVL